MADNVIIINTANTLSPNFTPGQDKRFPSIGTESIFTFGDFRLDHSALLENVQIESPNSSFSSFATLANFSSSTYSIHEVINTKLNELNPKKDEPQSYAYFGSFYTRVASSINNIIANYPYTVVANGYNTAITVSSFVYDAFFNTSTLKINTNTLLNQGNVMYGTGFSSSDIVSLTEDYTSFCLELSASTTHLYPITFFSANTSSGYLSFKIQGNLFKDTIYSGVSSASTSIYLPVLIRPTEDRFGAYKRTISNLEHQLLFEQTFMTPDPDDESLFIRKTFVWPKTIDGYNIDTSGNALDSYTNNILTQCGLIDEVKTNWMIRTMIPENYLELDSENQIYQKLISVYADEFDKIKQYIDNLAYAHTVSYNNQEAIPNKFMSQLSKLLGFKFNNAFEDADIFEYLTNEDDDDKTLEDYNIELWNRILNNINYIYKKKGTRDVLQFIFKLIGAPDNLINFNEFVYNIKQAVNFDINNKSDKINDDGYIDYGASIYAFQEGGLDRGNGQNYINQWHPEFDPHKQVDNTKIRIGDDAVFGTANVINSKELQASLDPALAIETDVKEFYDLGYGAWLWGTDNNSGQYSNFISPFVTGPTGTSIHYPMIGSLSALTSISGVTNENVSFPAIYPDNLNFNDLNVSYETLIDNVFAVSAGTISAMTVSQWVDFVYSSNIDPRNHKVYGAGHSYIYKNLKNIYLSYYYWTNRASNELTFRKLEKFLTLIERNFVKYMVDLLPSTTIINHVGTLYRNTVFDTQKFVYPAGINDGSEFKIKLPDSFNVDMPAYNFTATLNDNFSSDLPAYNVAATFNDNFSSDVPAYNVTATFNDNFSSNVPAYNINTEFNVEVLNSNSITPLPVGTAIIFPTPTTIYTFAGGSSSPSA